MGAKTSLLMVAVLSLAFVSSAAAIQESDTYAEEYALYQKADQEKDPAKQKALVLEFMKKFKSSRLDPNMSFLYFQHNEAYRKRGAWQEMATSAEEFLRYRPSDQNAAATATEAYQKLGKPGKLVQFGTRLYNQKPSASAAYLVANAYKSMNDFANFEKWAERTVKLAPNNAEMLVQLIDAAWRAGNLPKAAQYGAKAIKALEKSPEDNKTNLARAFAYRAMGEDAYIGGKFADAQSYFGKASKLDPGNDFAHFRLGYCYWRSGKTDRAINAFAKAVVLKGSNAKQARQEMYNLLHQRYGNTRNAAKILSAAKAELGVQ